MATQIVDDEHVARYCGFQKLVANGTKVEVSPAAFELRTHSSERFLSVNHCEHHSGSLLQQLRGILNDLTAKAFRFASSGALAVVKAGSIRSCGEERNCSLRVRRRHHPDDTSYASIDGLPLDNSDKELLQLLAAAANAQVHLVKNIP